MMLRLFVPGSLLLLLLTACVSSQSGPPRKESRAHYLLGISALTEGNPTLALQEFLLAEKEDSGDADIQAGLAQAYIQKQAWALAEKHLKRAISLNNSPQHHNNLGALYLTTERYDDSIAEFRKAAEDLLFATPEVAWTGVGFAYFKKNDYSAAESYYQKARDLNPRYANVHFRLGELYYHQDRPADAIGEFARSIELAPRRADGYYWLGLSAMKTEDKARARRAFEETIKLAPDSEQARLSRNHLQSLQ